MRQLLSRVDDEVHERLKERAAAEGRSLNSLVVEILRAATTDTTDRERVRERARTTGRLHMVSRPRHVPSWDELREATAGTGGAVSAALDEERAGR